MPPHKGQVRFGWRKLSEPYRSRLERQGISQRDWEDGVDLRAARGKTPEPPRGAAPIELVESVVSGEASVSEMLSLERRFVRPSWIDETVSADVAAALSLLPNPSRWAAVRFIPRPDGQPWTMIVTPKGARLRDDGTSPYDISIPIPGGGGPGSGAREVLEIVDEIAKNRRRGQSDSEKFSEILGSQ